MMLSKQPVIFSLGQPILLIFSFKKKTYYRRYDLSPEGMVPYVRQFRVA